MIETCISTKIVEGPKIWNTDLRKEMRGFFHNAEIGSLQIHLSKAKWKHKKVESWFRSNEVNLFRFVCSIGVRSKFDYESGGKGNAFNWIKAKQQGTKTNQ